jgi:FkbM family methyltransferase
MTAIDDLVQAAGGVSRRLHGAGVLPGPASAGVRFLSRRLAGRGRYLYRNQAGHVVEADLDDYMERIGFFGAHAARLIRVVPAWLRPGDWAIDAGANVGLLSSPLAAAVGGHGRVWAVEPLPANVERLRALKDANHLAQLDILPMALASSAGTAKLRLSSRPGGSGSGSFVAPWAREDFVEVETVPLDHLTADRPAVPHLRLVKLDVEGYETHVLAGAAETLRRWQPRVVCEFHDQLLRAAGSSSADLLAAFAGHGYAPAPPFDRPRGSLEGKVVDLLLVPHAAG